MENQTSSFKFSLNLGLITGIIVVVYSLIMYVLEVPIDSFLNRWAGLVFYIVAMFWGVSTWKKKHSNGFVSFGKAYGIAFRVAFFALIIGTLYLILMVTVIDPSLIDLIKDTQEQSLIDQGYSGEQLDQALKYAQMFVTPAGMAIMSLVSMTIIFALVALIPAAIMKKEEPLA